MNGEIKTDFIIRKKPWVNESERFYLIAKQGNKEIILDWVTSNNISKHTFKSAGEILLRNFKNSLQFEDNTINLKGRD